MIVVKIEHSGVKGESNGMCCVVRGLRGWRRRRRRYIPFRGDKDTKTLIRLVLGSGLGWPGSGIYTQVVDNRASVVADEVDNSFTYAKSSRVVEQWRERGTLRQYRCCICMYVTWV